MAWSWWDLSESELPSLVSVDIEQPLKSYLSYGEGVDLLCGSSKILAQQKKIFLLPDWFNKGGLP